MAFAAAFSPVDFAVALTNPCALAWTGFAAGAPTTGAAETGAASAGISADVLVGATFGNSGRFASATGVSFEVDLAAGFAGEFAIARVASFAFVTTAVSPVEKIPAAGAERVGTFAVDAEFNTRACATAMTVRGRWPDSPCGATEAGTEGAWPCVRSGTGSENDPRLASIKVDGRADACTGASVMGDGETAGPSTGSARRVG